MSSLLENLSDRLKEIFDPAFLADQIARGLTDLIVGALVFLLFYLLWRLVRIVVGPLLERAQLDETASSFVTTVIKYSFWSIGVVYALDAAGIDTSAVLASLGIAGLTIGFAARDALSNIISGVLIFLDRPFVIGDLVEIEDTYGRVDHITLRSTRIVTVDGKMLAVPNNEIINKTVASYTNFPHLRLDLAVTVAVDEDLERVRKVLLKLVDSNPEFLEEPPPRVVITQLNDYNVAMELQAWLADERQHVEKRFELREAVFDALNQAGVEMPYETIQLAPLEVKQSGDGR
jgi:small conductance mechanosensitive channel